MGNIHTGTSRLDTFAGYSDLEVEICASCGVLFAAPSHLLDSRRHSGESFYCPNGHSLSFDGNRKRLERRAREADERAARLAAQLDQAEAGRRAQKARATRFKNERDRDRKRVAHGVCPCCKRSFKNLRRHMEGQHPDFEAQEPE